MRYPGENAAGRAPGRRQSPSGPVTPPETRPAASGVRTGGKASGASLFAPGYSGGRAPGRDHTPPGGGGWYEPAGGTAGRGPARGFAPAPGQPPPLYPPGQFAAWNRASAQGGNGYDPSASGPISDAWPTDYLDAAAAGSPEPGYAGAGSAGAGSAGAGSAGAGSAGAGSAEAGYSAAWYADAGYADAGYPDQGHPGPGFASPDPAGPGYPAPGVNDSAPDVTSPQTWGAVGDTSATSSWGDLSAPSGHDPDAEALRHGLPPGAGAPVGLAGPELGGPGLGHPDSDTDRAATGPNQRAATGPFDRATPAPFDRVTTAPNQRIATRPGTGPSSAQAPGRGPGTRGRGSRRRKRPRGRRSRVRVLLACGLALIVVAGATYYWLARGHKHPAPAADSQRTTGARPSPRDPSPSPSPSLGPWGHIESRALDPVPLTLAELFPASFADGSTSYVRTVQKAKVHCAGALAGSQLISAVGHADCTQAMRASYLSSDDKLMGTIGVLNLITAAAAEQAGKAAGPSEFIAQLPAASGPTKNLTKGTGFEAAEVKGHYLVLVWAEFADLRAPGSGAQRAELESFISLLMQKTANVSLASRMVTGSPAS